MAKAKPGLTLPDDDSFEGERFDSDLGLRQCCTEQEACRRSHNTKCPCAMMHSTILTDALRRFTAGAAGAFCKFPACGSIMKWYSWSDRVLPDTLGSTAQSNPAPSPHVMAVFDLTVFQDAV